MDTVTGIYCLGNKHAVRILVTAGEAGECDETFELAFEPVDEPGFRTS